MLAGTCLFLHRTAGSTFSSNTMKTSNLTGLALALLAALALCSPASAQTTRGPLRIIVPVDAGAGTDNTVRTGQAALTKALGGRPVLIDNQPAAGGMVGTQMLVRSAPDGNTIMVTSNNHVVMPTVYKKMSFDVVKDITPIAMIGGVPLLLVTNPAKTPAKDANELVAYLRTNPEKFNFGSSGNGTVIHLASKMFLDNAKLNIKHIPYKGVSPQLAALISGDVDFAVVALSAGAGFIKSGHIRPVAVMGASRVQSLPEVKTLAEQGFAGIDESGWFAVIGPAGMPASETKLILEAFRAAYTSPEMLESMAKQNNYVRIQSSEEAARFIQGQRDKYAAAAKSAGLEAE